MSKRLELNLNMSFFKEDWAFKIDFSKCKNFEDLFTYLDSVVIEDINVGEQFRKMYTFPERCPLLDTFIPFRGFSQNTLNEFKIDESFEKGFLEILNDIKNTSSSKEKNQKLFDYINNLTVGLRDIALKIINLTYSSYYTYNVSLSAVAIITSSNFVDIITKDIWIVFFNLGVKLFPMVGCSCIMLSMKNISN